MALSTGKRLAKFATSVNVVAIQNYISKSLLYTHCFALCVWALVSQNNSTYVHSLKCMCNSFANQNLFNAHNRFIACSNDLLVEHNYINIITNSYVHKLNE